MGEHPEHLLRQVHLAHAEVVVQPGQRAPAQVDCRIDVLLAVVHDRAELVPVIDLLVVHILHRRAGDDEPVEPLVAHLVKGFVKRLHVFGRGMGGAVGGRLQKGQLHLQRAVGQQPGQLGLGDDLGRHQVQNQDAQRADILGVGALAVHDKDVLL